MWPQILRLLTSVLNIYSFYANPVRYILSLLMIVAIPYLVYIFWESLIIIGLAGLGIYFVYWFLKKSGKNRVYY